MSELKQNFCDLRTPVRRMVNIKLVILLVLHFFTFSSLSAENYRVNASNGLNIRSSANKYSEVIGKLSYNDIVDVTSIENGWATINYNGEQGYISASFIENAAKSKAKMEASEKKSGGFFSWLFNSEGESSFFTAVKWLFFIGIAVVLIRLALLLIIQIIAFGLVVGLIGLFIGFLLKWIGLIEPDTMWGIARWGFYIGNGLGVLYSFSHFGDLVEAATESSSSSSSSSSDGLKRIRVTDGDGKDHTLTQTSKYSECGFTDEDGHRWEYYAGGYRRI